MSKTILKQNTLLRLAEWPERADRGQEVKLCLNGF